jgi:hypothetical protein
MTRPSAPDSLREYVDCKCKTGCGIQRCSCLKAGLKCTECCRCANCQNKHDENTNAKEISDGELSDADSSDSVCESDYELFEESKSLQVNSALFILYTRHFVFGQLKRLKRTKHTYGWCQEFPGNNADELLRE